jgi:hypothetical protein
LNYREVTRRLRRLGVLPAGAAVEVPAGQAVVGILAALHLATTTALLVTQKRLRQLN